MGLQGAPGPQGTPGVSGYQIVTAAASSANLGSGKVLNATAQCPSGAQVLGGGIQQSASLATLMSSYPDTNQSWFAETAITNRSRSGGHHRLPLRGRELSLDVVVSVQGTRRRVEGRAWLRKATGSVGDFALDARSESASSYPKPRRHPDRSDASWLMAAIDGTNATVAVR
jgi:hypothetical protein